MVLAACVVEELVLAEEKSTPYGLKCEDIGLWHLVLELEGIFQKLNSNLPPGSVKVGN